MTLVWTSTIQHSDERKQDMRKSAAFIIAGVGAAASATALFTSAAVGAEPSYSLKGTWQVVVDPQPTPGGDQPPFESTISFGQAQDVVEATSKSPTPPGAAGAFDMSTGLGTWTRTGPATYRFVVQKYRFDATGAYIGKTVIEEDVTLTGPGAYTGLAVTKIYGPAGGSPAAQFTSTSQGTRMMAP